MPATPQLKTTSLQLQRGKRSGDGLDESPIATLFTCDRKNNIKKNVSCRLLLSFIITNILFLLSALSLTVHSIIRTFNHHHQCKRFGLINSDVPLHINTHSVLTCIYTRMQWTKSSLISTLIGRPLNCLFFFFLLSLLTSIIIIIITSSG